MPGLKLAKEIEFCTKSLEPNRGPVIFFLFQSGPLEKHSNKKMSLSVFLLLLRLGRPFLETNP